MTTKKRNLILGGTAVLTVLAAVVPELRHRPSTLLGRAHKVTSVGSWDAKHDNYFWLPNREALLITQAANPHFEENPPVTVRRVNAVTGAIREDAPLGAALHQASVDSIVPNWQLSPDGKWLLGESKSHTPKQAWVTTSIDGTRQVTRPHQYDEREDRGIFALWRPDSRSWIQAVEINNNVHIFSYRLDTSPVADSAQDFFFSDHSLVGFFGAGRVLAIRPQTGDGGGVGVADFGDGPAPAPASFYIPQVPANMDVQEVTLSPDRNRLAWKFTVKPLPLGLKATISSRYVRQSSPVTAGLWTTDLNLNNLHEIGTVDIRDDHITNLRWTPDGKRLSFIDGDALYTVPVD